MRGTLGSGIKRQSVGLIVPRDLRGITNFPPGTVDGQYIARTSGWHIVWAWGQGGQGGFVRGATNRSQTAGGGGGAAFVVRHIWLEAGQVIVANVPAHQPDRVMPAGDGNWGWGGIAGGTTVVEFPDGTSMTAGGGGGGGVHNPGKTLDSVSYGGIGGEPGGTYTFGWFGGAGGDAQVPLNSGVPIAWGGNACPMPFGGTPGAGATLSDYEGVVGQRAAAGGGGTAGGFYRAGGGNASAGQITRASYSPGSNNPLGRGNPGHVVPTDATLASYSHGPGGRAIVYIQYEGPDIIL